MDKDKPDWHFLINPAAGRGKAQAQWLNWLPRLQQELPGMTWEESKKSEGMATLAAAAVQAGKYHLVGVGGDGTHHDILNGIVAAKGLGKVVYAPLPLGTGNDWVRSIQVPRKIDQWLAILKGGDTISHAVGQLRYTSPDGETPLDKVAYFLNVAGMAYDSIVVRYSEKARFKHRWIYPLLTLLYLRKFTPPTVCIEYNGASFTGSVHTVNFGIGKYSGGGMRLVPHADPKGKTLALTFARELPTWKIIKESWRFYTGSIGGLKEVTTAHTKEVKVSPVAGEAELEADGEWLGLAPVRVSLLQERLTVISDNQSDGPT